MGVSWNRDDRACAPAPRWLQWFEKGSGMTHNREAVFDADGWVLEVGDTVIVPLLDQPNPHVACDYVVGTVAAVRIVAHGMGEIFFSEPGNAGAEGWIRSELVRIYI